MITGMSGNAGSGEGDSCRLCAQAVKSSGAVVTVPANEDGVIKSPGFTVGKCIY